MRQPSTLASAVLWTYNRALRGQRASAQELFLTCPFEEALLEGGRGAGKTFALLIDFARDVGRGYGEDWRGVLLRRTYADLKDVLAKSYKVFPSVFPGCRFYESASDYFWEFADGERLYLGHIKDVSQYWGKYHGHEYPWQGYEELTAWPDLALYDMMIGCWRSSNIAVAKIKRRRATTNPWGPGHHAVKARFVDPAPTGRPITDASGKRRVRIYAPLEQNRFLLDADPNYKQTVIAGVDDPSLKRAWAGGADRWDISAGAYFADVFRRGVHVLNNYTPPKHWARSESFDWGSAKPFDCQWFAESPGETIHANGRDIWCTRGTLIMFSQYYGASAPNVGVLKTAKTVASEIKALREHMQVDPDFNVADSAMWAINGQASLADDFASAGVDLTPCTKGPGSRVQGWHTVRKYLAAALPQFDTDGRALPAEEPALYITDNCTDVLRTLPTLQRDEHLPDDIDTKQEDHSADALRYRLTHIDTTRRSRDFIGG